MREGWEGRRDGMGEREMARRGGEREGEEKRGISPPRLCLKIGTYDCCCCDCSTRNYLLSTHLGRSVAIKIINTKLHSRKKYWKTEKKTCCRLTVCLSFIQVIAVADRSTSRYNNYFMSSGNVAYIIQHYIFTFVLIFVFNYNAFNLNLCGSCFRVFVQISNLVGKDPNMISYKKYFIL